MEITGQQIKEIVADSEMVLIGIGEEFERKVVLSQIDTYQDTTKKLAQLQLQWLMPYVNTWYLKNRKDLVQTSLEQLYALVEGKNFFLVSTVMNGMLKESRFPADKIVEPCGSFSRMQCENGCQDVVEPTDRSFLQQIDDCLEGKTAWENLSLPICKECGASLVFNTLYATNYQESGYLTQWEHYKKWLQGTVNKKLCVLELGVGLQFPSVIRFPFEKTVYFNQKAVLIRIHEKLYQLTEELKDRGYSVPRSGVEIFAKEFGQE